MFVRVVTPVPYRTALKTGLPSLALSSRRMRNSTTRSRQRRANTLPDIGRAAFRPLNSRLQNGVGQLIASSTAPIISPLQPGHPSTLTTTTIDRTPGRSDDTPHLERSVGLANQKVPIRCRLPSPSASRPSQTIDYRAAKVSLARIARLVALPASLCRVP